VEDKPPFVLNLIVEQIDLKLSILRGIINLKENAVLVWFTNYK